MMLLFAYLTIISLRLLAISAKQCILDPELQQLLDNFVVDVDPKKLEGKWMDIYVPSPYTHRVLSSYSDFNEEGALLKVTGHDFLKTGKDTVYYQTFTKIHENKGIYSFTGTYIDGSTFERVAYFIYVSKYTVTYYSCDPKLSIEHGWYMSVMVNAEKKNELLETTPSPNEVQMLLNDAVGKMEELAEKDAQWKQSHEGRFGLLGSMSKLDLTKLRYN